MPSNPVQPPAEKKRVAERVMREHGFGGVVESGPDADGELVGNIYGDQEHSLERSDLPNGWAITYVRSVGETTYVGVGPV